MYNFEERKFYSLKSGKLVAALNDANQIVFEPGMCPAHKKALTEWLHENGMEYDFAGIGALFEGQNDQEEGRTIEQLKEEGPEGRTIEQLKQGNKKKPCVDDIPDSLLPYFDPRLGMDTDGLQEFILKHGLDVAETEKLIRRLERKIAR